MVFWYKINASQVNGVGPDSHMSRFGMEPGWERQACHPWADLRYRHVRITICTTNAHDEIGEISTLHRWAVVPRGDGGAGPRNFAVPDIKVLCRLVEYIYSTCLGDNVFGIWSPQTSACS